MQLENGFLLSGFYNSFCHPSMQEAVAMAANGRRIS